MLKDVALSRWAGAGALDWDQPVGLWLGELPASGIQRSKHVRMKDFGCVQNQITTVDYIVCQMGKLKFLGCH